MRHCANLLASRFRKDMKQRSREFDSKTIWYCLTAVAAIEIMNGSLACVWNEHRRGCFCYWKASVAAPASFFWQVLWRNRVLEQKWRYAAEKFQKFRNAGVRSRFRACFGTLIRHTPTESSKIRKVWNRSLYFAVRKFQNPQKWWGNKSARVSFGTFQIENMRKVPI